MTETTTSATSATSAPDTDTAPDLSEGKTMMRAAWASGDYHRFAKATIWELGPVLVEACGITAGHRVLDVAAGTGNTAIRAAERGAEVTASDLTPENFAAGRAEALEHGVDLTWVEGDAEQLPFEDAAFDVVTSSFGAIFAPHHEAVAHELARVCRPGGTIGLLTFAADGLLQDLLDACGPYLPPPVAGAQPPTLWGEEEHVRHLLGPHTSQLTVTPGTYTETAATPEAYVELFCETFGPIVAAHDALADDPTRQAALTADLREFATRHNGGSDGGPAEYHYDYCLIVGRRRDESASG